MHIFEWIIVAKTIRMFSFKVINAEVLQYTSIIYGAMGNRNIKSFGEIDF
jgi:hypothetical protein